MVATTIEPIKPAGSAVGAIVPTSHPPPTAPTRPL
jgi:hypothetical protein